MTCNVDRLPADSLGDDVETVARTVTSNGTVPLRDTLGTVPSNDTVVKDDTVLCSADMALDMSSQSVEIITNEESNLLDLDLQATSDVTASRDLDPDTEGQFMTARFYIGESLPESPTSESSTRKVGQHRLVVMSCQLTQQSQWLHWNASH